MSLSLDIIKETLQEKGENLNKEDIRKIRSSLNTIIIDNIESFITYDLNKK